MGTPDRLSGEHAPSEAWLELLDRYSAGVFWWDPAQDRVHWSQRIFDSLGYVDGDGASYSDIEALRHPDEVEEIRELVFRSAADKSDLAMTNRLRHADGSYRNFRVRGIWSESQGGGSFLLGYLTDITEMSEALEHAENADLLFKNFFEEAPCGVFLKDGNLRYLYGNQQAAKLAGCTLEELLSRTHDELFDKEASATLRETDRRVLDDGETLLWSGWIKTRSGERRFVMNKKFPILDPVTKETVIAGFGIDLTDQKINEEELDRLRRLESLGELVTGIAHDFNNTLAVVQGNLELLADKGELDAEERRDLVQIAADAVRRGARLTQDLLSFGRRSPLQLASADLNVVIDDMLRMLRRTIPESIEIMPVKAARLWPVSIDRSKVEDAVLNLAINARDAMPAGGTLTIETANVTVDEFCLTHSEEDLKPGRYVLLAVTDTGVGMDENTLQRAFDPFFTTKAVGQGTGMGLSMVFGLMKQLGGTVHLYSEIGIGTTLKLYFPIADATAQEAPKSRRDRGVPGGSEHVLVVEDEERVREVVCRQLTALGYTVAQAQGGEEGLEILAANEAIELVVTDVVMPGSLLGTQLAQRARALRPDLPFIFISGYPAEANINGTGNSSFDRFLMKPVPLKVLANAVRDALDAAKDKEKR